MQQQPEVLVDTKHEAAEGPLWHPTRERLYWVNIDKGELHRYHPETDRHEHVYTGPRLGGFTIQEDDSLLLFMDRCAVKVWDGRIQRTRIEELPDERETRFNDVIADPEGRVFAGTMGTDDRPGRLYRLDPDGSVECILDRVDVPNGMGFSPDNHYLYLTESEASAIHRFEYDRADGSISNRETVIDVSDEAGVPDGMTVDEEGFIWSARWNGGCLVRYRPDGTEVRRIAFPAERVSSVTFGGDHNERLYATTAGGDNRAIEGEGAGAIFEVETTVRGQAEFRSRL